MSTSGAYDHEAGSSCAKCSRNVETMEEALLPDVHHEFLEWRGCSREAKSRYNSRRLGLYHDDELEEEGFDTYFQGGLRSNEKFNAREYRERISLDRDLHLSRSSITSVRFSILRVLHKMITYGLCQRTTGYEKIKRNDLWLLSMFEDRHQNGDLDRTTLRELIDSKDRLIPDIPVDDVPRVAAQRAPRVQRASMHDLYERMGSMEIR
ncbi:hypothetical protein Tco_1043127 [Tanacetum coccineum]|uniref:Uncharacterized protein n=1 Tax=Tanacetum coccineum TaxID=301880 RepID=A0ABQ5GND3_9ASTR